MAKLQTSFLGGRWSQEAQGRVDDPLYKVALSESLNGYPTQEGAWTRRPGFYEASRTRDGNPGAIFSLSVDAAPSHVLEFTSNYLRIYNGANLLTNGVRSKVVSMTSATPTLVGTETAHGLSDDDHVLFRLEGMGSSGDVADYSPYLFRELKVQRSDDTHFWLYDLDGHGVLADGTFDPAAAQLSVARVLDIATPYPFNDWQYIKVVQANVNAFILNKKYQPQVLTIADGSTQWSLSPASFVDGPYLDQFNGIVANTDALTGVVNLTFSYQDYDATKSYSEGDFVGAPGSNYGWESIQNENQGNTPASSPTFWQPISTLNGFANKGGGITEEDLGRHVRMYSEPPLWKPDTDYATGINVAFNDTYYTALADLTGAADAAGKTNPNQPGFDPDKWVVNPAAARWTWGIITRAGPRPTVTPIPGHWEVAGFVCDVDCGRLNPDGTPIAPYTIVTPPATGGTGQCWSPNWRGDYPPVIPGVGGVQVPAADATEYSIFVSTGSPGIYNQLAWPMALHFTRTGVGLPAAPTWVDGETIVTPNEGLPGTAIGDLTGGAGLDKLFLARPSTEAVTKPGFDGYAGLALTDPSVISSARVFPVTQSDEHPLGFADQGITRALRARLYASHSPPANATDGTLLGTGIVTGPITSGAPVVVASSDYTTVWTYAWFALDADIVSSDSGALVPFGGGFNFTALSTYAIAASKMQFFGNYTQPAGTDIGVQLRGDPLLYTGEIRKWMLGRYNNHMPTWPVCGAFYGGRLWLGSDNNHGDVSEPLTETGEVVFSPTEPDGAVTDGSAFDFTITSDSKNPILWMKPEDGGVLVGTSAKEWLVAASEGTIVTSTNKEADPVTSYGSADVEPISASLTTVFVSKSGRTTNEMMRDVYSGKLAAPSLQDYSQDLTVGGVVKMAYTTALTPIIWCATALGSLIGDTYRRATRFSWEPPTFNGWHRHEHGQGRSFLSVATNNSVDGKLDTLAVLTQDEAGICRVEVMANPADTDDEVFDAMNIDGALTPVAGKFSDTGVTLYGLWALNNQKVSVFLAGLDCGDFAVDGGKVEVPYLADENKFLTRRFLEQVGAYRDDYPNAVNIGGLLTVPCLVGFCYTSQAKTLRATATEELAVTDSGLGIMRRQQQYAILVSNTGALQIGTTFDRMNPVAFRDVSDSEAMTATELYSGLVNDTLEDESSFDGELAWESNRMFPATITAINTFQKGSQK